MLEAGGECRNTTICRRLCSGEIIVTSSVAVAISVRPLHPAKRVSMIKANIAVCRIHYCYCHRYHQHDYRRLRQRAATGIATTDRPISGTGFAGECPRRLLRCAKRAERLPASRHQSGKRPSDRRRSESRRQLRRKRSELTDCPVALGVPRGQDM